MPQGYLVIYEDDTWRKEMGRYDFNGVQEHTNWSDAQQDKLSSLKFLLPAGWELRVHTDRDVDSVYQSFQGTGQEKSINKNELDKKHIHDKASSHSWAKIS